MQCKKLVPLFLELDFFILRSKIRTQKSQTLKMFAMVEAKTLSVTTCMRACAVREADAIEEFHAVEWSGG